MNKKIKIIDLLNKHVNGEKMPEKIKYDNEYYILNENSVSIENLYLIDGALVGWFNHNNFSLNSQVEIIEEIDKLEIDENGFIHTNNGAWKGRKLDVAFVKVINKLAEEVKNIKEK